MVRPLHRLALTALAATAVTLSQTGCQNDPRPATASPPPASPSTAQSPPAAQPAALSRAAFRVEGMTCGGCVIGTRAALRKLDGVTEADASYETSSAWAVYDPEKVTPERMIAAIAELGYTATLTRG